MAWPVTRNDGFDVDEVAWNEVVNALSLWGGDANAGGHNLAGLGKLTLSGGAFLQSAATRLGVNVAAPLSPFTVLASDDDYVSAISSGVGAHFQLTAGSGIQGENKLMAGIMAGADTIASFAWIQAIRPGTSARRLCLNPVSNPGYSGVGIGTTAPFSPLSFGTGALNLSTNRIAIYEQDNGHYFRGIGLCDLGGSGFALGLFGKAVDGVPSNTTADLVITDSGRVGIGKNNPGSRLGINGLLSYASNAAAIAGGLTAGDVYIAASGDPRSFCIVV